MADDEFRTALTTLLPRLRRFGVALTRSRADADELVQTLCEKVLLRSGQLLDRSRMDAWLFSAMRNLWISELRKRRIRQHEDVAAAEHVVGDDGPAVVEGRMTLAAVRRAMDDLSDDQRSVLTLVCVDGLSYRDAAEVLAIPIGTLMSRLSRARRDLHERIARPATAQVHRLFPDAASPDRPSITVEPSGTLPSGTAKVR